MSLLEQYIIWPESPYAMCDSSWEAWLFYIKYTLWLTNFSQDNGWPALDVISQKSLWSGPWQ